MQTILLRGNQNEESPARQAPTCHVPCDHIPSRSYPLFKARAILEGILSTHGYKAKRT
jgi:hypothetical protein